MLGDSKQCGDRNQEEEWGGRGGGQAEISNKMTVVVPAYWEGSG